MAVDTDTNLKVHSDALTTTPLPSVGTLVASKSAKNISSQFFASLPNKDALLTSKAQQNALYFTALKSLAKHVVDNNVPIPQGRYLTGTTKQWKYGERDEFNIAVSLRKKLGGNTATIFKTHRLALINSADNGLSHYGHRQDHNEDLCLSHDDEEYEESDTDEGHHSTQDNLDHITQALMELQQTPIQATTTPLSTLSSYLETLFSLSDKGQRLDTVSHIWYNIWSSINKQTCSVNNDVSSAECTLTWDHWEDALSLIVVLAAKEEGMRDLLRWVRRSPTIREIELDRQTERQDIFSGDETFMMRPEKALGTPLSIDDMEQVLKQLESKDFKPTLKEAWIWANLEMVFGKTTIIAVKLIDVGRLETFGQEKGEEIHQSAFEHGFLLGIGPEGFRMWQAWGRAGRCATEESRGGIGLDEWIRNGGTKLRTFEEGDQFVAAVERFLNAKGTGWNGKRNGAYYQAFGVDMEQLCGEGNIRPQIVEVIDAWVDVRMIRDVKVEDVHKFEFVEYSESESGSEGCEKNGEDSKRSDDEMVVEATVEGN